VRTVRGDLPILYDEGEQFPFGGHKVLRRAAAGTKRIVLAACGYMVHSCLKAADALSRQHGVEATVVDAYSLPLDSAPMLALAGPGAVIVTVEDNYVGGLGSELAEAAASAGDEAPRVQALYVHNIPKSGRTPEDVLAYVHLSVEEIVAVQYHRAIARSSTAPDPLWLENEARMTPIAVISQSARLRKMKTLSIVFAVLGMALAPLAVAGVKNVVLVHGAFADGSGWRPIATILEHDGYTVYVVQEPLTSWDADLAATRSVLDRAGPCVLVGHSWAGMIITEVGDRPSVRSLVYVAAFEPDVGETAGGLQGRIRLLAGRASFLPVVDSFT
jgi:hypothetical protein